VAKRDQDFFWEGVDRDELLAQKCRGCARLRHPPGPRCPHCGSPEWEPHRLSGRGDIHTWLVSRHPTRPDPNPRMMIVVQLEEGLRLVSNLVDAENARTGAPVEVEFGTVGGVKLPLFRTRAADPEAGR
jgi:uncharacterized OB-fold protein